jgi:hypothetical protein
MARNTRNSHLWHRTKEPTKLSAWSAKMCTAVLVYAGADTALRSMPGLNDLPVPPTTNTRASDASTDSAMYKASSTPSRAKYTWVSSRMRSSLFRSAQIRSKQDSGPSVPVAVRASPLIDQRPRSCSVVPQGRRLWSSSTQKSMKCPSVDERNSSGTSCLSKYM